MRTWLLAILCALLFLAPTLIMANPEELQNKTANHTSASDLNPWQITDIYQFPSGITSTIEDVEVLDDGSTIISGCSEDSFGLNPMMSQDEVGFVVKHYANGTLAWATGWTSIADDAGQPSLDECALGIEIRSDGDMWVVGESGENPTFGNITVTTTASSTTTNNCMVLAKLSADGEWIDANAWSCDDTDPWIVDLLVDSTDNPIIVTRENTHCNIRKYDQSMQEIGSVSITAATYSTCTGSDISSTDNIAVAGFSYMENVGCSGENSSSLNVGGGANSRYQFFVFEINSNMECIRGKSQTSATNHVYSDSVAYDSQDNLYISIHTQAAQVTIDDFIIQSPHQPSDGSDYGEFVRLNASTLEVDWVTPPIYGDGSSIRLDEIVILDDLIIFGAKYASSTNFLGHIAEEYGGAFDVAYGAIDSDTGNMLWISTSGGSQSEEILSIAVSGENLYLAISSTSPSVDVDGQLVTSTKQIHGFLVQVSSDADGDGIGYVNDAFPEDGTQHSDADSDGYGDNPSGNSPDSCPAQWGNSTVDSNGCPDVDGDGWSNTLDAFNLDSTQWSDSDGDGYGDNTSGNNPDSCPATSGSSFRDVNGCEDDDLDGFSNDGDVFPDDSSQWEDEDDDGYGDNPLGLNGDSCPGEFGESYRDRFGCPDSDGDGYSDQNDGCGQEYGLSSIDRYGCPDLDGDGYSDIVDGFDDDPTRWQDSDGDGYEDNTEDAFSFDPTQWVDGDGDGFGDNEFGLLADAFPQDASQWSDVDGDGYGDNPTGNDFDAFITDITQWKDIDGDGYGDNQFGINPDAFPKDPTQWADLDQDGFGDNPDGTNPDPFVNDTDNDGYNNSIDPLPNFASPGDMDNDMCPDEEDEFPTNPNECKDTDGDGWGDNQDADDDGDGVNDIIELQKGTDPMDASSVPVESFEIVVPGTAIGLGAWDLIGIFGGLPFFSWLGFCLLTRGARATRYQEQLEAATSREGLASIAAAYEFSMMLRMIGPHQGIRLERLRAELDDAIEAGGGILASEDQTGIVEQQLGQSTPFSPPQKRPQQDAPPTSATGVVGDDGYEWIDHDNQKWYRVANSGSEWTRWG